MTREQVIKNSRFFTTTGQSYTWPRIYMELPNGITVCDYLNYMRPVRITYNGGTENNVDFERGGAGWFYNLNEVSYEEAKMFQLKRQSNPVDRYIDDYHNGKLGEVIQGQNHSVGTASGRYRFRNISCPNCGSINRVTTNFGEYALCNNCGHVEPNGILK
jgi:predicted RNA-binding Zn-ribbon protein involved in translation (DUF1610 family)